jgi:hypothetical protein
MASAPKAPKALCTRPGCGDPIDAHELRMVDSGRDGERADRRGCMTTGCTCPRYLSSELPIDTREPIAIQSRHTLMVLDEEGLLAYRYPVDMRDLGAVEDLRTDLGGGQIELPDDDGVYYLVYTQPGVARQAAQHALQAAYAALPAAAEPDDGAGVGDDNEPSEIDAVRAAVAQLADTHLELNPAAIQDDVKHLVQRLQTLHVDDLGEAVRQATAWLETAHLFIGEIPKQEPLAVLIREGEVRGFAAGIAVQAGREHVEDVRWYRGLLPK